MTTAIKPVPTSPVVVKLIEQIAREMERLVVNLAMRWMDEHEYEDIAEYRARIETELNVNYGKQITLTVTGMSKRPFGFKFTIDGAPVGSEYMIYCGASAYGWKRTK